MIIYPCDARKTPRLPDWSIPSRTDFTLRPCVTLRSLGEVVVLQPEKPDWVVTRLRSKHEGLVCATDLLRQGCRVVTLVRELQMADWLPETSRRLHSHAPFLMFMLDPVKSGTGKLVAGVRAKATLTVLCPLCGVSQTHPLYSRVQALAFHGQLLKKGGYAQMEYLKAVQDAGLPETEPMVDQLFRVE